MENFWVAKPYDSELSDRLQKELNLPSSIVQLLLTVGIKSADEAKRFLISSLKQVHNPLLIKNMEKAIIRISEAIDKGERILFHGDYDCDGVTTIALAKRSFRILGVEIDVFAPNRFDDGYGLNPRNMEKFAQEYDLIITGDTGIRAFDGAEKVFESGRCDLIITDHHEPFVQKNEFLHEAPKNSDIHDFGNEYIALPKAYAVIDPHQLGDEHPCKTHAGVGVLFKTMLALFRYRNVGVQPLLNMMDLVATGTIVDLAHQIDDTGETLDFEVRVMCTAGLQIMNEKPAIWTQALREAMKMEDSDTVTSETLGFGFGPVINAVGRLYDPTPALELLLEDDYEMALEKANELVEINNERKEATKSAYAIMDKMKKEAEETGDYSRLDYGIVIHSDLYGEGVAGLVAGKFQTRFYRPSIALTTAENLNDDGEVVYKGSARSIPGIHILHMLDEVQRKIGPFIYGGHEQAAGMTIKPEQFEAFCIAFREACMQHDEETFIPTFYYQSEATIPEIDDRFMSLLSQFEPFGMGNEKPNFLLSHAEIASLKEHESKKGFNLILKQDRRTIKALSFDLGPSFVPLYKEVLSSKKQVFVDILFKPSYNTWQGKTTIQLNIEDIRISKKSLEKENSQFEDVYLP